MIEAMVGVGAILAGIGLIHPAFWRLFRRWMPERSMWPWGFWPWKTRAEQLDFMIPIFRIVHPVGFIGIGILMVILGLT
jgi:hypothetical protein